MSRMEKLKFMVDLNWRIRFDGFDHIFSETLFFEKFIKFLTTDTGKKWLTKENGLKYVKWQEK
ncbi:hypothetical protein LCGC14_2154760 [marine sediment metagenome]|uniref:Uncharacterized protein n=1 Tax=marine sediment metagenome TaxID=412755 RepID=A0A0F9DUP9_9ZZZZ